MTDRPVLELLVGDVVRLKRQHPCGSQEWLIDRVGADIGLRCRGCARRVLLDRRSVEARIAGFVSRGDPALTAALGPAPAAAGLAGHAPARDPAPADRPVDDAEPTS